jgi:5-methylcytosine-specific restriction endonuclease McrA
MAKAKLTPEQKERKRQRDREYYQQNRGRIAEAKREYYENNRASAIGRVAAWAAANPERARETKRAWALAHPDAKQKHYKANRAKVLSRTSRYQAEHREQARSYGTAHRARRSPEQIERDKEKSRRWLINNPEKAKQAWLKWTAANPDGKAQFVRNRRARIAGASGSHTSVDIERIFASQAGKCAGCGITVDQNGKGRYHVDHVMPISRGGSNGPENLQLLCKQCNLRKHAKHPDEWAREIGRLFA